MSSSQQKSSHQKTSQHKQTPLLRPSHTDHTAKNKIPVKKDDARSSRTSNAPERQSNFSSKKVDTRDSTKTRKSQQEMGGMFLKEFFGFFLGVDFGNFGIFEN